MQIKSPNVAGAFYPADPEKLQNMIQGFLDEAEIKNYQNIKGLIAPHAGYVYSGPVAACGYKQLAKLPAKKWQVIVMAPSHYAYFNGVSVGDYAEYETPLGKVKIATDMVKKLLQDEPFQFVPEAYEEEHSLEVQLPFLQTVLSDFELIPLIFGDTDPQLTAEKLNPFLNENTLLIASSDLSHFYDYEKAKGLDQSCLDAIVNQNISEMAPKEACGKMPILTLMYLAKMNNWKFELVDYRNSGDTAGDKGSVVGYGSVVVTTKP